jgi:hypothetical protein
MLRHTSPRPQFAPTAFSPVRVPCSLAQLYILEYPQAYEPPPPVCDTCSPVRVPCSHICFLILLCMCPHLLCMCPGNAVYVSSYCCVCVLVSSYCCMCVLILQYVSAQTAIYVCPHTDVYVSMCRRPAVYMCPDTAMYVCPHTVIHMSSYCYIYALILLYMCPHTAINVSSYCALVTLARARQFAPVREPVLAS